MARKKNNLDYQNWYVSFFVNGAGLFFLTLYGYYLAALYEKIKLESLGIPTEYAEVAFFNFVDYLDDLLLIVTPAFIIIFIILIVLVRRLFIGLKLSEDTSERLARNPQLSFKIKQMRIELIVYFGFGVSLILLGFLGIFGINHFNFLWIPILISGSSVLLFSFISMYVFRRNRVLRNKRGYLKIEKILLYVGVCIAPLLIIPQLLILFVIESDMKEPLELLIDENSVRIETRVILENENGEPISGIEKNYHLNFLVTEKNGYGVWGELEIKKNDLMAELSESTKRIEVTIGDTFHMKKIENVKVKQVSFLSMKSNEVQGKQVRNLFLKNTEHQRSTFIDHDVIDLPSSKWQLPERILNEILVELLLEELKVNERVPSKEATNFKKNLQLTSLLSIVEQFLSTPISDSETKHQLYEEIKKKYIEYDLSLSN